MAVRLEDKKYIYTFLEDQIYIYFRSKKKKHCIQLSIYYFILFQVFTRKTTSLLPSSSSFVGMFVFLASNFIHSLVKNNLFSHNFCFFLFTLYSSFLLIQQKRSCNRGMIELESWIGSARIRFYRKSETESESESFSSSKSVTETEHDGFFAGYRRNSGELEGARSVEERSRGSSHWHQQNAQKASSQ